MIKREYYGYNERMKEDMYRTYSDEGFYIRQIETGNIYEEAIDLESQNYTYEETDELIEKEIIENEEIYN